MTKPTQAQIAAAAESMMRSMFAPHELPLDNELREKYMVTAKDALTAAAEVGDKRWQDVANQGIHIETQLRKELLTIEAATIERCIQAVKDSPGAESASQAKAAAIAAIRALKDKP